MGKASRRKTQEPVDYKARLDAGLCLHCGQNPATPMWCVRCTANVKRLAEARNRTRPSYATKYDRTTIADTLETTVAQETVDVLNETGDTDGLLDRSEEDPQDPA